MTTSAPFYLYQFGTTAIPGYQGRFGWSAPARDTALRTIGGLFDTAGTGDSLPELPYTLTYTGLAIHASDTTQIRTTLDGLRARRGQRDRLWLYTTDGAQRWAWARLLNVTPDITATGRATVQFVLQFQLQSIWNGSAHGGDWDLDAGYYFDSGLYFDADDGEFVLSDGSPDTLTVTNDGNVNVDNCGITVTAGTAAITYLKIGVSGSSEFEYDGTIAAGQALVIDCGACTVLNNGLDAWNDFSLTGSHVIAPWLRLEPGNNSVVVTFTGGDVDSEIVFTYADGWA